MKSRNTEIIDMFMRISGLLRRPHHHGHGGPHHSHDGRPPMHDGHPPMHDGAAPPPMGMGRILERLLERDGMTQAELATELDLRPQSVSEALARLSSKGFIEKRDDENDRRVFHVYLTAEGRSHASRRLEHREQFAAGVLSALSETEKEQLALLLAKVVNTDEGGAE